MIAGYERAQWRPSSSVPLRRAAVTPPMSTSPMPPATWPSSPRSGGWFFSPVVTSSTGVWPPTAAIFGGLFGVLAWMLATRQVNVAGVAAAGVAVQQLAASLASAAPQLSLIQENFHFLDDIAQMLEQTERLDPPDSPATPDEGEPRLRGRPHAF